MVTKGIVLGHKISSRGTEVDKAKVNFLEKLPPPTNVKGIKSFLGHTGFYKCFTKDFSKIVKPLSILLNKDIHFKFDHNCLSIFSLLKQKLLSAPIIMTLNCKYDFELNCDASDYVVGFILGQRKKLLYIMQKIFLFRTQMTIFAYAFCVAITSTHVET